MTSRAPHAGKRGRGRPAREWVVGDTGHERLASDYDDLATDAVRFVRDTVGPEAVRAFADQRMSALEARCAAQVDAAGDDPRARTEALTELRRGIAEIGADLTADADEVVALIEAAADEAKN